MLNIENLDNGIPFAVIKSKDKKLNNQILYVNPDSEEGFNEMNFKDATLEPLPNPFLDREVGYTAGPSGSGKSTMTLKYAKNYRKLFPENNIYVFSRLEIDPALLKLGAIPVNIDDNLDNLDVIRDIRDALCIFDDIDTITDKKLRDKVYAISLDILETGRHNNIYAIITSHLINGNDKKMMRTNFNESKFITLFPKGGNARAIRYALKEYIGLDNKQVDEILKLKSRWVTIHKQYPQFYYYENGAKML